MACRLARTHVDASDASAGGLYSLGESGFRRCAIPGYLIVSVVPAMTCLARLGSTLAAQLGVVLVRAVSVVEEVIQPLKLYCARFEEETHQLHFHIFPRTHDITQAYLAEYSEQQDLIHGPILLDCAHSRYKNQRLTVRSWKQIERIRARLHGTDIELARGLREKHDV